MKTESALQGSVSAIRKSIILFLVLSSPPTSAEWQLVSLNHNKKSTDLYLDYSTIRPVGEATKRIWGLLNYKKVTEFALSMATIYEFDCDNSRYRETVTIGYTGHMGNGDIVWEHHRPRPWNFLPPASTSVMNIALKTVC